MTWWSLRAMNAAPPSRAGDRADAEPDDRVARARRSDGGAASLPRRRARGPRRAPRSPRAPRRSRRSDRWGPAEPAEIDEVGGRPQRDQRTRTRAAHALRAGGHEPLARRQRRLDGRRRRRWRVAAAPSRPCAAAPRGRRRRGSSACRTARSPGRAAAGAARAEDPAASGIRAPWTSTGKTLTSRRSSARWTSRRRRSPACESRGLPSAPATVVQLRSDHDDDGVAGVEHPLRSACS